MVPLQVPLHCINEAAIEYHIPAKLIISILEVERGKLGKIVKNKNGTYDIGPAQINSLWLPTLQKFGITQNDIQFNACTNVKVGAWLLSKEIANSNELLKGIGNFHSHTEKLNQEYSSNVKFYFNDLSLRAGY